jgi:Tol biopolymer transport system component
MNISKTAIFVLMTALSGLFLFAGSVVQTDAPGVRLRAAIEKEEVEGDLQVAIEQYKKIIANNGENRAVAASALLRLGGCYEKLGREEARKTYEQLIADYPDQQQEVTTARQRLAAIATPPSQIKEGMAIRMLWKETGQLSAFGQISPDGRHLSWMSDSGDLEIKDLKTGESRVLTNEGDWEKSVTFVTGSRWSPDGKQIVYSWYMLPFKNTKQDIYELRIINAFENNAKPRILYRGEEGEAIKLEGWFPDGKSILVSIAKGPDERIIARFSIDDGEMQVLKETNSSSVRLSPDGKYIAYEKADTQSMNKDIFLFSVAGSGEMPLVTGSPDDVLLDWTPDGRYIFFSSNRSGTYDAWLLSVENGEAHGLPQIVKQDFGTVISIGFSPSGEFYFGREVIMHDIFIADWDAETGKIQSTPKKATESFAGATYWPEWSLAGERLAYIVHRGALYRGAQNQICIRNLETGRENTVPILNDRITSVSWSPDGKSLLLCGKREAGKAACWVVDSNSGNFLREIVVPQGKQSPQRGAVWAPDGSAVYYSTIDRDGRAGRIVRHNLLSNDEKILYSIHRLHNPIIPVVSPDGGFLAFMLEGLLEDKPRLMLIPTAGGDAQELMRMPEIPSGSLAWSPDSRYVYFARGAQDHNTVRLCRVSVSDGTVEELQFEARELTELRIRPDGRQIAFTQFSRGQGGIWVMENFLPQSKQEEGGIQ